MVIEAIAPQAKLKGLHIVGTGDAFHPGWRKIIEESTEYAGDGVYVRDECSFIITAEVEDSRRIHHLIILPSLEAAEEMGRGCPQPPPQMEDPECG